MSQLTRGGIDTVAAAQRSVGPATPVLPVMLDQLFTCFMRRPQFLAEARQYIRPNQFNVLERHYAVLWNVLCEQVDQQHQLNCSNILMAVYAVHVRDPSYVSLQGWHTLLDENANGLVWSAYFNTPDSEIDLVAARDIMRQFLHERTVAGPLRQFMSAVPGSNVPEGLDAFLHQLNQQQQRLSGIAAVPYVPSVPDLDAVIEPPSVFVSTGVPFIDNTLGGQRVGDSNGLFGPTGGGKSTLAAFMAAMAAKAEYHRAVAAGRTPGWVGFFSYEEPIKKMQPRVWSAACMIPRMTLESLTRPREQLSAPGQLKDYERTLQAGGEQLSEQERWAVNSAWLNASLKLFDMSGSDEFPTAGQGFVAEIRGIVDHISQTVGAGPVSIFLDWGGMVVRNYMRAMGYNDDSEHPLLSDFGDMLRREIAEPFRCTSWCIQQIAPGEISTNPTTRLTHTQAQGCKAFATNMAVCGCLSSPDETTGCRYLNWSKVRYRPNEDTPPQVLRIHKHFAVFEDVTRLYVPDRAAKRFMSQREASAAPPPPQPQSGPPGMSLPHHAESGEAPASTVNGDNMTTEEAAMLFGDSR